MAANKKNPKQLVTAVGKVPKTDKGVVKLKKLVQDEGAARVVQALNTYGFLERVVGNGAGEMLDYLLELGVDVEARPSDKMWVFSNPGPLGKLLTKTKFSKARIPAIADQLIELGAKVDRLHPDLRIINPAHKTKAYSVLDFAALTGRVQMVARMLPLCDDPETAPSATVAILRARVAGASNFGPLDLDDELSSETALALLAAGLPKQGMSRYGLPVPFAAVLAGDVDLFEAIVGEDSTQLGVTISATTQVEDRMFEAGAVVNLPRGSSLLDLVDRVLAALERRWNTWEPNWQEGHWGQKHQERASNLRAIRGRLVARGVGVGEAVLEVREDHRAIYDAMCRWVNTDAVGAFLDTMDADCEPWLYLRRLYDGLAPHGLAERLEPLADQHVLAWVLTGKPDEVPFPMSVEEARDHLHDGGDPAKTWSFDSDDYPEAARRVLDGGRLVGRRGEVILCTTHINGGNLWGITLDGHEDYGDAASMVAELDALLRTD